MLIAGVAGSAATPVRACSSRVYPGDGGGCAQVRRSPGLAFQGRKRSRSGPARGFPPLARFGGDEFVVLLEEVTGVDVAVAAARRICAAVEQPSPRWPFQITSFFW